MRTGRRVTVWLAFALLAWLAASTACRSARQFPESLSDLEFSELIEGFSEPAGEFTDSENLVSNEAHYVQMIPMFDALGGVYVGVGPEQNFSYIAALRPEMAFVIDIRRENRALHLMYKALFEVSADRGEFLSRLFSRGRPAEVGLDTSVPELFIRFATMRPSAELRRETARLVRERLLEIHAMALAPEDLAWIDHVLDAFYADGPEIHYQAARPNRTPSYRDLMTRTDYRGNNVSFLATEERFNVVKDLHARNLIVPLVGDFGGHDAIRRVGEYTREHGSLVRVFYASNVQVYLSRAQRESFCDNLEDLPSSGRSWFIGSNNMQRFSVKLKNCLPR